jgi:hypothetical protein
MKIIHTVISADGFRDVTVNLPRIALFKELVTLAERNAANVLILPAGFLTVSTEAQLPEQIERFGEFAGTGPSRDYWRHRCSILDALGRKGLG